MKMIGATLRLYVALICGMVCLLSGLASAAPYAAMVMDARNGKILHSRNADTRLHPASLTKMMTLYVAFEAVQNGELSMDTKITVSRKAAAEPPSKLGLRAGQKIALKYLVRAAAIKSGNDAATAIAEGISGSEAAFARRMNRTAKSLGMTRTTFRNAHGLTQNGHLSTARDMTVLGRALFYHYPQYYNIFKRRTTDAGVREVSNTNRRLLNAYRGADGIKTGYTRAAGFNLVASAERNGERIIATVFGGRSTATRNARVAELLDLGFKRAPRRVATAAPSRPGYAGNAGANPPGKVVRLSGAVKKSLHPQLRPGARPAPELLLAMQEGIAEAVETAALTPVAQPSPPAGTAPLARPESGSASAPSAAEQPSDDTLNLAALAQAEPTPAVSDALAQARAALTAAARVPADAPLVEAQTAAPPTVIVAKATPQTVRPKARQVNVASAAPTAAPAPESSASVQQVALQVATVRPMARPAPPPPDMTVLAKAAPTASPPPRTNLVTRVSTSGGRLWRVSLGTYSTRFDAERALLETALREMTVLDGALRKVVRGSRGFEARFLGLSEAQANRTCSRLQARGAACDVGRAG